MEPSRAAKRASRRTERRMITSFPCSWRSAGELDEGVPGRLRRPVLLEQAGRAAERAPLDREPRVLPRVPHDAIHLPLLAVLAQKPERLLQQLGLAARALDQRLVTARLIGSPADLG